LIPRCHHALKNQFADGTQYFRSFKISPSRILIGCSSGGESSSSKQFLFTPGIDMSKRNTLDLRGITAAVHFHVEKTKIGENRNSETNDLFIQRRHIAHGHKLESGIANEPLMIGIASRGVDIGKDDYSSLST
jgi:hypothetical protein